MEDVSTARPSSDELPSARFVEGLPFPDRTSTSNPLSYSEGLAGAIRIQLPEGLALHRSLKAAISARLDDRGSMVWTERDQVHVLYGLRASELDGVLPLAEGLARKLGGTVMLTAVMELPPSMRRRFSLVGL